MGYSQTELDDVQAKWKLRFPPDLIELLRQRRPLIDDPQCFDWISADPEHIRDRLAWPFKGYWTSVQRLGIWWPEWGERPTSLADQYDKLRGLFADAPKLIPLLGHRYIPDEPHEKGNPVFSVVHSDIVHYGADLLDWMEREREPRSAKPWPPVREIRFWGQAVRYFNNWSEVRPPIRLPDSDGVSFED